MLFFSFSFIGFPFFRGALRSFLAAPEIYFPPTSVPPSAPPVPFLYSQSEYPRLLIFLSVQLSFYTSSSAVFCPFYLTHHCPSPLRFTFTPSGNHPPQKRLPESLSNSHSSTIPIGFFPLQFPYFLRISFLIAFPNLHIKKARS